MKSRKILFPPSKDPPLGLTIYKYLSKRRLLSFRLNVRFLTDCFFSGSPFNSKAWKVGHIDATIWPGDRSQDTRDTHVHRGPSLLPRVIPEYETTELELERAEQYIGHEITHLRAPSLVLDKSRLRFNCERMLKAVEATNHKFRADTSVMKTSPLIRMMLGTEYKAAALSSLEDINGIQELIDDGAVDDIRFIDANMDDSSLTASLTAISQLMTRVKISFSVGNHSIIQHLNSEGLRRQFGHTKLSILVDIMDNSFDIVKLEHLVNSVQQSSYLRLVGFHFRQTKPISLAQRLRVLDQLSSIANLAERTTSDSPLILSIRIRSVKEIYALPFQPEESNLAIEYCAGGYAVNDLRHVSGGFAEEDSIAMRIATRVYNADAERRVVSIQGGGSIFPGFGTATFPGSAHPCPGTLPWYPKHIAPIAPISLLEEIEPSDEADFPFYSGMPVEYFVQSAVETSAAFQHYFVQEYPWSKISEVWNRWV